MTSPYAFYQYWLNVEDASVVGDAQGLHRPHAGRRSRSSSGRSPRSPSGGRRSGPWPPTSRRWCTVPRRRRRCRRPAEALFGKGELAALDAGTLVDATAELPGADVAAGTSLVDALVAVGLVDSRNAARRAIGEGGASLNNVKVTDPDQVLAEDDFLHGRVALLKRGRRNLAAARKA